MAEPIRLRSHKVLIESPREMVYQKVSSIGRGRLQGDSNDSAKVITRSDNDIVAEFKTKVGPFTYTTVEHVTLEPPERMTFKHLKGPLHYAWEELVFNDVDGNTELVHNGEIIWRRLPVIGWLAGRFYTKPMFERVVREHMRQIKVTCEARATRSHVFRRTRPSS